MVSCHHGEGHHSSRKAVWACRSDNAPGNVERVRAYKKEYNLAHPRYRDELNARTAATRGWIASIKLERGCADCGYNEWPEALDFDHLPGTVKRGGVAGMTSASREKVLAEIDKCEVVCANCHRHRTAVRRQHDQPAFSP